MWPSTKVIYFSSLLLLTFFLFYYDHFVFVLTITALSMIVWFLRERKEHARFNELQKDNLLLQTKVTSQVESLDFQLKELINALPFPLVYINQRGGFEVQNSHFKRIIQIQPKNVYDILIDSDLREIMLDAFLNEQQFIRRLNHKDLDYQVHSVPIIEEGRYMGCMIIFQDISSIVAAEIMQKRFIADASHELKTPITSIKGMMEILMRPEFVDQVTKMEFLLQTEKEVNRLNRIVEDLLLQSHLRENKLPLEKTSFNLRSFFEDQLYELRHDFKNSSIDTILDCPSDLIIYADHSRLRRVFLNLLKNAINYSKEGEITIECLQTKKELEIRIEDSGQGISKEALPYVFDRFFRGELDRNRARGGSGLGLAISQSIIEAHDGKISVESNQGLGSTFIIKLTQT